MVRRKAKYILRIPFTPAGIDVLPPEFARVAVGQEWGPGGEALWRVGRPPRESITACLSFLARHLTQSSIPSTCHLEKGDFHIFLQPPVLQSGRKTALNGVCLEFSRARITGLRRSGRYRNLVLGNDTANRAVVIGAHRLICWAVHGPLLTKAEQVHFYACHTVEGCEQRLPCCSPLHLRWASSSDNRNDVGRKRCRVREQCAFNLRRRYWR